MQGIMWKIDDVDRECDCEIFGNEKIVRSGQYGGYLFANGIDFLGEQYLLRRGWVSGFFDVQRILVGLG